VNVTVVVQLAVVEFGSILCWIFRGLDNNCLSVNGSSPITSKQHVHMECRELAICPHDV